MAELKDKTAEAAKITAPKDWHVIDTTAQHGVSRTHEQIIDGRIKAFTFEAGKPLGMPQAIAIKFLRDAAFVRTDEKGEAVAYERAPRQPEELGAGEKLTLKDSETIARYDELSTRALLQRVVVLPGGEKFASGAAKPATEEMVAFIVAAKAAHRKANTSKASDTGRDDFVPEAEDGDDELAA